MFLPLDNEFSLIFSYIFIFISVVSSN